LSVSQAIGEILSLVPVLVARRVEDRPERLLLAIGQLALGREPGHLGGRPVEVPLIARGSCRGELKDQVAMLLGDLRLAAAYEQTGKQAREPKTFSTGHH